MTLHAISELAEALGKLLVLAGVAYSTFKVRANGQRSEVIKDRVEEVVGTVNGHPPETAAARTDRIDIVGRDYTDRPG
jgi:hypothetical protein